MPVLENLTQSERSFMECALVTGSDAPWLDETTVDAMLRKFKEGAELQDFLVEETDCLAQAFEVGYNIATDNGTDPDMLEFAVLAERVSQIRSRPLPRP